MAIRSPHFRWLRSLTSTLTRRRASKPSNRRRIRLEQLESRYVLAAPVAVDDAASVEVNTVEQPRFVVVLALQNDTDADFDELRIVEAAGQDLSFETSDVTIPLEHGVLTVIASNGHPHHFSYEPNINFMGTEAFTYRASDGGAPFSNLATVTIDVNPVAVPGDYAIFEGGLTVDEHEPLVLDGSASRGPGLTYSWFINGQPIGTPNSTDPTLAVSWSDFNSRGITDGGVNVDVVLQVEDDNGETDSTTTSLGIENRDPQVTVFEVTPDGPATCGAAPYHMVATFSEPNPLESPFEIWVDWEFDFSEGPFFGVSEDAEQIFDYESAGISTGFDDLNFPQFTIEADHTYTTGGARDIFIWVLTPNHQFADFEVEPPQPISEIGMNLYSIDVTIGGAADPPTADIQGAPASSVPGKEIDLSNLVADACGVTYAWTVIKDSQAFTSGSGEDFSFTPDDPGTYEVHLTASNGVDPDATDDATISVVPFLVESGELLVGGTAGSDTFVFTPAGGQYSLVLNGVSQGTFSESSVQVFGDAADAITIDGDTGANSFVINADSVALNGTIFNDNDIDSRTINALGSGDSITVTDGSATVNGGSASDTLTLTAGTNDWHITANNAGSINAGQIVFTSIENLVGGSGNDTFRFDNGFGVNNGVEGGGGTDTLDYSAYTASVNVNLNTGNASHTGGISSIENLIGGTAIDNLTAPNTTNTWTLSGADAGNLNGAVTYSSFENLNGGSQVDTFVVGAGATVNGDLDGNGGADVLNYSSYGSSITVNLETSQGTAVAEFSSIASFVGTGVGGDSLTGEDNNNTWTVTSDGAGTVDGTGFSGFESLQGGSANDTFRVNQGVTSGISINGGNATANDKLDYAAYTSAVNVDLGAGTATGFASVAQIENVAGGDGNDIIRGDGGNNMLAGNQGADIILGGGGNDTLNGNAGRDILIGGSGADTILGNADEDILIAGTTSHDADDIALAALLSEWTSAGSYGTRTGNVTNGTGLANGYRLDGNDGATQTVFNDADVDTLTGNGGVDWYFANQNGTSGEAIDIVTTQSAGELWNDTDF